MDFIEGHEKLTGIFGRWPSFHDAEVLALGYERRDQEDPSILLVVHLRETTPEVDEQGYYKLVKHTRVTFRFHDCHEIAIEGNEFNGQNVLRELRIEHDPNRLPGPIRVDLEAIYGVGGTLICGRAEVVEAVPFASEDDGELLYIG